jgi:hypothetical protein
MSTPEQRSRLAELIQDVIDGRISPKSALELMETGTWDDMPWKDREINAAWHALVHFEIDEDIRQKEPGYDSALKDRLRLHVNKLKRAPHWPAAGT